MPTSRYIFVTVDTLFDGHVVALAVMNGRDTNAELLAAAQDASSGLHLATLILVEDLTLRNLVGHASVGFSAESSTTGNHAIFLDRYIAHALGVPVVARVGLCLLREVAFKQIILPISR